MWDAAGSLLDLSEYRKNSNPPKPKFIECCVVDFKDAFHTLHTLREEWPFVMVRGLTRWVVFLWAAFGLTSHIFCGDTLLHLQRELRQSMVAPRELRMQVYVGNPILNAAGSRTAPLHSCNSVVGGSELQPELEKGPGPRVERTGGEFNQPQGGVTVQLA